MRLAQHDLVRQALERAPEVRSREKMLVASQAGVQMAKKEYYPDVTLAGTVLKRSGDFEDMWALTATFNIPLYFKSRQGQAVAESRARHSAAVHELAGVKAMLASGVRDNYAMVRSADELMILYRQGLLPKTMQDVELSLAGYRTGRVEEITAISRLKALIDYELSYWAQFVEREKAIALKHKTVEKIYFVEIDEEVINVSRKFFPGVSSGLDDPRVEIKIMDGAEFVMRRNVSDIDAVIIDTRDIIGFARSLFTGDFFTSVKRCLTDDGMFVTHTESLHFHKDMVIEIQEVLKSVFPLVDLYTAPIATYPGNWWVFAVASKGPSPRDVRHAPEIKTKYYDAEIHRQSFMTNGLYEKLMQSKLEW